MDYQEFLKQKSQSGTMDGFDPVYMPDFLFDFQKALVEWSLKIGKAAIFADCGLGKTPISLVWAKNVVMKTNKNVLIITPLSVSYQFVREGDKFGIECVRSKNGEINSEITVTNYERLHLFSPNDFSGVVVDEASAIKAFDGKRRKEITRFLSKIQYRLLGTATPSPNDYIELGTLSEALGCLNQSEMLSMFFKSSDNARHSLFKEGDFWNNQKWFFKAHAEVPFWRWICSWARGLRKPSDLGNYDDTPFILPDLKIKQHVVKCDKLLPGELFPIIATTLREQRAERRATLEERCSYAASLAEHTNPVVLWCHLNPEGDMLEKMIPESVQVAGKDSDEDKEERLNAFTKGDIRVMITKQRIGGWGLNWQHCGHHIFFPSHSFEGYYQAIRRSYRFGRIGDVNADIVTTEGEAGVTDNLKKKQEKANIMFTQIVSEMNNVNKIYNTNIHTKQVEVPQWLL